MDELAHLSPEAMSEDGLRALQQGSEHGDGEAERVGSTRLVQPVERPRACGVGMRPSM